MPVPSFLRHKTPAAATSAPEASPEAARTRARRRLIGAVLLLGIGVIAFPLLFETEPRPIPVDLPIEIPKKDGAPPLAMPAAPSASALATVAPPPMITEPAADPAPAASAAVPVANAAPPPAPAASALAAARDDGARAQALLDAKPASAPAGEARYVVQIGAFAEDKTVREVRAKAQNAGLETYIQVITPAAGKRTRVRIGPFPRREEADAAAAKAQKAGLPASVIRL